MTLRDSAWLPTLLLAASCASRPPTPGTSAPETSFFHEFGHLIHHLVARSSRWVNESGVSVEWDFVEASSQLLEEWVWDPAVLARFARHHATDAPIPAELVAKMRAAEAREYREKILAPGGRKDAAELVRDVLGRDASLDAYRAWLERDG